MNEIPYWFGERHQKPIGNSIHLLSASRAVHEVENVVGVIDRAVARQPRGQVNSHQQPHDHDREEGNLSPTVPSVDHDISRVTYGGTSSFQGSARTMRTMLEVPRQPLADAFMLTSGALHLGGRTAFNARRVNSHAEVGQETVRHEPSPRHRVTMQRLLVDLDLFFESDLRERDERLPSVTYALGFNPHDCVPCHSVG